MKVQYFQVSKEVGPCAFMFGFWKFRVTIKGVQVESTETYGSEAEAKAAVKVFRAKK